MIFEGEYKNRKRNGYGKEYYFSNVGNIIFEGEYLNGKRWIGKIYDKFGKSDWQLINSKGIIKEYDLYGKLEFEGEYINGLKIGEGKEYYEDGYIRFEGELLI